MGDYYNAVTFNPATERNPQVTLHERPSPLHLMALWNRIAPEGFRIEPNEDLTLDNPGWDTEVDLDESTGIHHLSWHDSKGTLECGGDDFAKRVTLRYPGSEVRLWTEDLDSSQGCTVELWRNGVRVLAGVGGDEPGTMLTTEQIVRLVALANHVPLHGDAKDDWIVGLAHEIDTGVIHPGNIEEITGAY